MTENTQVPAFLKGGENAEKAQEEQRAKMASRPKLNYFGLKAGETKIYRLLTDSPEWIYIQQHNMAPTKDQGPESKLPKVMTAVCRNDRAFKGIHDRCYLCDNPPENPFKKGEKQKATPRVWALAVEREMVTVDGERCITDVIETVKDKDDKEYDRLKIVLLNMPFNNFFTHLQGMYAVYGTVCDRDMQITRNGTGKDTEYRIVQLDATPDHKPGTESWELYTLSLKEQGINLDEIVAEKATDEFYGRMFDPNWVDPNAKEGAAQAAPAQAPQNGSAPAEVPADELWKDHPMGSESEAAPAAAPDKLAEIRARLSGVSKS